MENTGNLKESNHNYWNLILLTIATVVNMILAECPVIVVLCQTECISLASANVYCTGLVNHY